MVHAQVDEDWPQEGIPDSDFLFYKAHRDHFVDGKWRPGVFRDQDGTMSTDWSKYGSTEELRQRANVPEDNAIFKLPVGGTRETGMVVEHTPLSAARARSLKLPPNRAHTAVIGKKTPDVRIKLRRIYRIEIGLGE